MNEYKFPTEMMEQFAQAMKAAMPAVKANKNGFELRTKVLEFAQNQAWQDYYAKWGQFETSIKKEGNVIVTDVTMPAVPGADAVLETANKFYEFVSNSNGINKK
jgi:hypothetical protein